VVGFVYRDFVYNDKTESARGLAELILRKHAMALPATAIWSHYGD